ncbi:MAG: translocation/assembly module TamB domain-containing protein [Bacteroides sp.]|nr:translocation/assembly module TamB domain-containing protein [Bacteroides sp.]
MLPPRAQNRKKTLKSNDDFVFLTETPELKRLRKFIRILAVFLISIIGLIVLLFIFINLPFSDRFVTKQTNSLFSKLDLPLHIESIRTVLPNKVKVEGVTISGPEGDTIICAMDLDAKIRLHALLKKKVKLKQVYIGGVVVHLDNDSTNTGINIARAFSKKDKEKAEKPKEIKGFWEIDIRGGDLQNVNFKLDDPSIGIHISEEIERLKLTGFNLSLQNRSLIFKSIKLDAGRGGLRISPRLIPAKKEKGAPWNFEFKKVQLSDLDYTFNQVTDSVFLNLVLQEGLIRTRVTDFAKKEIDADIISLNGADITILTGLTGKSPESAADPASPDFPWDIIIDETDLQKVKITQGTYSYPEAPDTASPPEIALHEMHLIDTRLNKNSAEVKVKKLGFSLANGFDLKQMKGEFTSTLKTTQLAFSFESENSRAKLEGDAEGSIFEILENPNELRNAHLTIQNTQLSLKDVFYFKNDLKEIPTLSTLSKAPIDLDGAFGLDRSMISLQGIEISQLDYFSFAIDGNAEDPLHPKDARGNLEFELSALDALWLSEMLEELVPKDEYATLTSFSLQGSITDSLGYSGIKLGLKSNLGELNLSGIFDLKNEAFDLNTAFSNLNPGPFLNAESLGALSGSGKFSGNGFSQDSLSAKVSLLLDSLSYNDYQYTNTSINGKLAYGIYEFNLLVDDPNLKTGLYTTVSHSDSTLILNTNGMLAAQLGKLNFSKDTASIETTITAVYSKSPGTIESEISLLETEVSNSMEEASIQEINAIITTDSSQIHLKAEADFFTTDIYIGKSTMDIDTLINSYRSYLLAFSDTSKAIANARISQLPSTNITGNISNHEALGMILQDTGIRVGNLDFSLTNSASDQSLNYVVSGNDLKYRSIEIGELQASAVDSAGIMDIQVLANKNIVFENPAYDIVLKSHYDNWQSSAELTVIDDSGKFIYNLALASDLDSNMFVINLPEQKLLLNSQQWEVENPKLLYVNLEDKKVYPSLKMHTGNSTIQLYSNEVDGEHQYVGQFDSVSFNSVIQGKLLPGNPGGIISGKLSYGTNEEAEKNIYTDLQFNNVEWNEVGFGLIDVKGNLKSDTIGSLAIDMLTRIDSSKIDLKYNQSSDESRSLSTNFTSLPLSIFQPFLVKHLSEMNGNISGNFNISNEGKRDMDGTLNFNGASLRINMLNSRYKLPDEHVQFSANKLVFDNFNVLDSLKNKLDINGFIEIDDDWKVSTNLNIGSSGIQVMNTSGDEGDSFYGDIFLDSRLSVIGPVSKPVVKGKLLLARGSEIYYRYLEDLSLSESAKYVRFVTYSEEDSLPRHFSERQTKLFESSIETILEIDPATRIHFNLSKWAFDIDLGISGGGTLNFQMLNNNQYSLSGGYLINEGEANLKLVGWPNKSFRIAEGGQIRWDGKIDNPNLKVEASNRVASSYTNPVDGQVRNLDIDVILKLSNQLSDLDVEFTIFTTDQYLMSIISTLSPEEQMRQAITILLFETIDLPGISTSTNYMTQQVNQLVASQLNSLTKTTISGIDISFGVNTYVQATEGGGEETKTSLSYDVQKTFADERAQMKVSGRMNDVYNQPGASNFSMNNISLEYQLDSAASRYLKVYNERSYEDVFEGEVVKTGVGITFRKRYWNIKDIWMRKKKKK